MILLAASAVRAKAAAKRAKRKAKALRIARIKKPTRGKLIKQADALFGALVRSVGYCQSGREKHAGPLQCAHGFSRRYEGSRWTRDNAWCLCAGCHVFYTHRPLEWDEWMHRCLGPETYAHIRSLALSGKADMDEVLRRLG